MSVTMICPNLKCGKTVVAPDSARGKVVRCAYCEAAFMVPAAPVAVAELAQEQPPPEAVDDKDEKKKKKK